MSSFLDKKDGIFDPLKRFAFTNISDEPYTFQWGGIPTELDPGETIELPEYLALHATRGLVDNLMIGIARKDTEDKQKINPMYLAPNMAGSLGIPAARKPFEDKILKELTYDASSDKTLGIKRQQIKEQLTRDMNIQPSALGSEPSATQEEFVSIGGDHSAVNLA